MFIQSLSQRKFFYILERPHSNNNSCTHASALKHRQCWWRNTRDSSRPTARDSDTVIQRRFKLASKDSPSHTCVWTAIQEGHRYNLSKLGCPRSKSPKIGSFPQRALRADQPLFAESVVPRAPNPEQQNPSRFCPSLRPYRLGLSRACSQR
eukprot:9416729-Pyramimonas_sp.AAC.3